jgi:hypothetical protein
MQLTGQYFKGIDTVLRSAESKGLGRLELLSSSQVLQYEQSSLAWKYMYIVG